MNLKIIRHLKTKDIEWFWVGNKELNFECDLLIIDTHRPSSLDDFPHMKEFVEKNYPETKSDYENPNLVKAVYFLRGEKPGNEIMEELGYISERLLSHLVMDGVTDYEIVKKFDRDNYKGDKDEINVKETEYYYDIMDNYLMKNFGFTKDSLNRFKNPTFHFLTQEKTWDKEMEEKYKIEIS